MPIAFTLPKLYVWARPEAVAADPILQHKHLFLNMPFFLVRAAIYFGAFGLCTYLLNKWSAQQDRGEVAVTEADTRRFRVVSAPGLLLYVVLMSLASVDWLMSLDAALVLDDLRLHQVAGQGCSGRCRSRSRCWRILVRREPMNRVVRAVDFHDLGKLMLAFVMLWAYFSFSQFLIIWAGNLPDEIPFYLNRLRYGWQYISCDHRCRPLRAAVLPAAVGRPEKAAARAGPRRLVHRRASGSSI